MKIKQILIFVLHKLGQTSYFLIIIIYYLLIALSTPGMSINKPYISVMQGFFKFYFILLKLQKL